MEAAGIALRAEGFVADAVKPMARSNRKSRRLRKAIARIWSSWERMAGGA